MLLCGTSRQGYNLTHTDEKGDGSVPEGRDSLPWRRVCFVYFPSICLLLLAGFVVGRVQTKLNKPEIDCKPEAQHLSLCETHTSAVDPISIVFASNRTFLQRPSEQSDLIWSSLYPANHGFFNYPDESPRRSTFAGFHQLHCVVCIQRLSSDFTGSLRVPGHTSKGLLRGLRLEGSYSSGG